MCGFCGFVDPQRRYFQEPKQIGIRMSEAIRARGPDGSGFWLDRDNAVALAHRRLSILDLSDAGTQPMASPSGRYHLVYNGEIYNHHSLRADLEQASGTHPWRGHSDTETLLVSIEKFGLRPTLEKCVGMFSFGLWDRQEKELVLSRDRMGEKPLYFGFQNGVFLFGSDLKSLKKHPAFENKINESAISVYLRHSYIPAPHSIYQGIAKVEPGTFVTVSFKSTPKQKTETYWSVTKVAEQGTQAPISTDVSEARNLLKETLSKAITGQLLSDVSLGAFLSGGIDSSTIVALMQSHSNQPVKTFSIGFEEDAYNEAVFARNVARHLKTDHTEFIATPDDAMAVIPDLPKIYSEPFADSSQIPTYLVSKLARQHVTVSLSGDGADELFCGYNRYLSAYQTWSKIARLPASVREKVAHLLFTRSPSQWDSYFARAMNLLPRQWHMRLPGEKIHKFAGVLQTSEAADFLYRLTSTCQRPEHYLHSQDIVQTRLQQPETWPNTDRFEHTMMAIDSCTYLPGDILTKVDRASMACSLEARAPYLDHRVVELSWKIPFDMKVRNGQGKWILRQLLYEYVPKELVDRPKTGFGVPIGRWLKGPLRDWAEALLSEDRLRDDGYFRPETVRTLWGQHLSGSHNAQHCLWNILMFQAWREQAQAA